MATLLCRRCWNTAPSIALIESASKHHDSMECSYDVHYVQSGGAWCHECWHGNWESQRFWWRGLFSWVHDGLSHKRSHLIMLFRLLLAAQSLRARRGALQVYLCTRVCSEKCWDSKLHSRKDGLLGIWDHLISPLQFVALLFIRIVTDKLIVSYWCWHTFKNIKLEMSIANHLVCRLNIQTMP